MQKFSLLVLGLALVSQVSQARSLRPVSDVAPTLQNLPVTAVSSRGEVAKVNRMRPFTDFVITVPVSVDPLSACTSFAGQQTTVQSQGKLQSIQMLGASDPINDVCIAVMPEPVQTQLTVKMKVLTGGVMAADPIQRQVIQVMPLGLYEVVLDMGNNSVSVNPLRRVNR